MLAEVEEPVKEALGIDTVGIQLPTTIFGYRNENWKPFRLFDGTQVEISGNFQFDVLPNGDIVQYPKGDRSVPPSGRMPKDGWFFDTIVRQEPIDEATLDPKEWVEQSFSLYTEEDLRWLEESSRRWFTESQYSLVGSFGGQASVTSLLFPVRPCFIRKEFATPRNGTSPRSRERTTSRRYSGFNSSCR